jgi:hypothetical protein
VKTLVAILNWHDSCANSWVATTFLMLHTQMVFVKLPLFTKHVSMILCELQNKSRNQVVLISPHSWEYGTLKCLNNSSKVSNRTRIGSLDTWLQVICYHSSATIFSRQHPTNHLLTYLSFSNFTSFWSVARSSWNASLFTLLFFLCGSPLHSVLGPRLFYTVLYYLSSSLLPYLFITLQPHFYLTIL